MRFCLPEELVLVERLPNIGTVSKSGPQTTNGSILDYVNMENPISSWQDNVVLESMKSQFQYLQPDSKRNNSGPQTIPRTLDVESVITRFEKALQLQNEEVKKLVKDEEMRLRRVAEDKAKKEAAEKARIEAEKTKQLEMERLRKQEEKLKQEKEQERLRKLAEEKANKEKEEKLKLEEEKRLNEEEQAKLKKERLEAQKLKEQQSKYLTDFTLIEHKFLEHKQHIIDIKTNVVEKVAQDPTLKKHVGQLRRKINPKFGQLSNSMLQFNKINGELQELVNLAKPNPLAFQWILNFVAKAIVDQAETEVIVQPAAAVPLARLACSLLHTYPEFEYFLTARFVKKCPFIIGYTSSIQTEEGRAKMGWKRKDNKWEDEVKYDERVSGICSVWSVMTRTTDFSQLPLYSFEASWSFIARLLNTEKALLTNAHFSLAANWWESSAKYFLPKYGIQSQKLMQSLTVAWTNLVSDLKFPAAARLLIFGEDWIQNGIVDSIKEMER